MDQRLPQEYNVRSRALVANYTNGGQGSRYSAYSQNNLLPNVSLLPIGTVVSVNYSNSISISATPNGFTVLDLATHKISIVEVAISRKFALRYECGDNIIRYASRPVFVGSPVTPSETTHVQFAIGFLFTIR